MHFNRRSALLPRQPSVDWSNPLTRGLSNLFLPTLSSHGGQGNRATPTYEGVNLAGSAPRIDGTASGSKSIIRYTGTTSANVRPRVREDVFGPYWDIASGNILDMTAMGGTAGWDCPGNGGHQPVTMLALLRPFNTLSGTGYGPYLGANGGSGGTGTKIAIGHNLTSFRGVIGTGTATILFDLVPTTGHMYAIALTSRSPTDHAQLARNMVTGVATLATSSTNSGTSGVAVSHVGLAYRNGTTYSLGAANYNIYGFATWSRGLSNDELYALLRNPWSLWHPAGPRRATLFGEVTSPPVEGDDSLLALGLGGLQAHLGGGPPPFGPPRRWSRV